MKKLTTRLSALALSAALSVTAVGCAFASNSAYTHPFTDVPDTSWYASYVDYAYAHHLFAGTSATTFTPGRSITRGEVVTALASMHERLTGESTQLQEPPPFSDVPDGAFYAMPVTWAAKLGIVAGCGDGTFQPNRAITREELACMLQSYLTATKASLSQTVTPTAYTDAASISAWASDAVTKLSAHGVFTGDEQHRFLPQGMTTRAEAATVLTQIYQAITGPSIQFAEFDVSLVGAFTITNAEGETLTWDGETFSGTMDIQQMHLIAADPAEYVIRVPDSSSFTYTQQSIAKGKMLWVSIIGKNGYIRVSGTNIDSFTLDDAGQVHLNGTDMQYEIARSTDGDLQISSGSGDSSVIK